MSLFAFMMFALSLAPTFTANAQNEDFTFGKTGLNGESSNNPTSLQFGPDNRLYVSQQNGTIYAYTVERNNAAPGSGEYTVVATEQIDIIKNTVQNHNDDGSTNNTQQRQVTGILVVGTPTNPILYVTSSDSRISVGDDSGLDTNSGVVTRLTWNGASWDRVDIVRGLARSEENHSTNGMALDPNTNTLFVMSGGHANKGAPGNNLSGTPEYWVSAAMLSVDLDAIEAMPIYTDSRTNTQFIYDLPTLDDPTRANVLGSANGYPSNHPLYNEMVDPGDPFGGNNGLNQGITIPGDPLQVYSPGYRNAYDVLLTEAGRLYTWDNGPNGGWGGLPIIRDSSDNLVNYTSEANFATAYQPENGIYCTNEFHEDVSNGHGDVLAFVTEQGYYGGHPAPIRAFPSKAGIIAYVEETNNNWVQEGPTYSLESLLPAYITNAAGYNFSTWFPDNPVECTYTTNDSGRYLSLIGASTNGLTEYTASNFNGGLQGDILVASFNGSISRVDLDANGDANPNTDTSALFTNFGSQPLDVTAQADDDIFPGTVWAATYGADTITIFEPSDFGECEGTDDPLLDEDFDNYDNADEIANGTNPCNGGDVPSDFDGDFDSDLLDNDDDNDGIEDKVDAFQQDADNGLSTNLPINYPFQNNDPGTGFFGVGFTGLMTNGEADYLALFDEANMTVGGAGGKFTIDAISAGDAYEGTNSQEYAFQVGVNVDTTSEPFTVRTSLETPYFFDLNGTQSNPQNYESYGFYIGTGDQDNYLKLVLRGNNGTNGFQVLLEDDGASSQATYDVANILSAGAIELYFIIDPAGPTVQPAYSSDGGGTVTPLGSPLSIPAAWLNPSDDKGLAIGLISTANGSNRDVGVNWDFLTVLASGPAVDDPIDDVQVLVNSSPTVFSINNVFVDDGGIDNMTFSITDVENPSLFDPQPAINLSGDAFLLTLSYATDAVGSSDITVTATDDDSMSISDTFTVIIVDEAPILYRLNTGGPTIATIDDGPDWITDTAGDGATYLVEGGENTFAETSGSAYPGAVVMTHPSLPSGVPSDIFNIERWDPSDAPEMTYAFPATAGSQATVRLYFAELFNGVVGAGERVFDVSVEGSVPGAFNNIDAFATAGAKGAIMVETTVTVGPDGDIDLVFIHDVENPAIKGIEILGVSDGNTDEPPVVNAFGTQTSYEGDTPDLTVDATDDGASLTYGATGLPPGLDMETTNGHIFGTIANGASANSPYDVTISVDDGVNTPIEFNFIWNILDPNVAGTILYRVNNGGPEVAAIDGGPAWSEDQVTADGAAGGTATAGTPSSYVNSPDTNSAYATNTVITLDSSVPASVPASLFQTERWDDTPAPEMLWDFPVANGKTVEVRLYLAEIFDTTATAGGRVFDVAVEGSVPAVFDDLEPYAVAGNQQNVGAMVSYTVEITDGVLNLEFIHGTENPSVKAIEIVDVTPTGGNEAPTVVNAIQDITILENETISDINLLAPQVFEDDVDGAPYMIYGASSDNTALLDVSVSTTTLSFTVAANSTGTATITVTAEDSGGLVGTDTFLVTVEQDNTDNPPVVEVEIPDVTVDENAAPALVDLAAAFEDDITLDADLDYSVMSNSNLPLLSTSISGTELTLTFSADMFGTASIEVKAEDELGQSITDTFTVTVNEVPDNYAPVSDNGGIPDQTAEENDSPITIALVDYFSDVEDADVDLTFNVVGNTNLPLVSTNIVSGDLTLTLAANMFGTATISVTATDTEGATSTSDSFILTVNEYDPQDIVLYRVNNGGPELVDSPLNWEADQSVANAGTNAETGTPSPYLVLVAPATDTTYGPNGFAITNATGAPDELFAHERYSQTANPDNMQWEFPATQAGWYQINLYFAENWDNYATGGPRIFDVEIEGNLVLDDYEPYAAAGDLDVAVVESIYMEVTDGTLDLDFIKDVQNPSIKGIEIIQLANPPANLPPTLSTPLEDVEVFVDSADTLINLDNYFSDPEALTLSYSANIVSSIPSGLVSASITDSTLTLSYTPATTGVAVVTVTATDSEAQSISETFSVTVIEAQDEREIFFRVNAGGPELPAIDDGPNWDSDLQASQSTYHNAGSSAGAWPVNSIDPSVPSTTPANVGSNSNGGTTLGVFQTERYDPNTAPEMEWDFAVPIGTDVEVRVYMMSGWDGASAIGQRVFDMHLDGVTVLDDYDIVADVGHRVGTMHSYLITSDGNIDLDFFHEVENPTVAAIEILEAPLGNHPPTVQNPIDDISVEENGTIATIDVSNVFDDADLPTDTLTLSVLSTNDTLVDAVLNGTDLTLTLGTNESGVAAISLKATDDAGASATDTFTVTVTPPDVVNTPPTVANAINDIVQPFGATSDSIPLTGVFTDAEQDDATLTLSLLGISNLTLFDNVTVNGSTLEITYATGVSGTSNITVRATDNGGLTVTNTFNVTVQPDDTPGNNPPTVENPISDVSHIVNDVASEIVDLTGVFADVEDDAVPTPLNLVVLSNSNLGLVDASISGTDLTLTYTPNVVSSATLTVRAFDSNGGFVDDSFVVTINAPANTPPTVANPLADPTEYELGAEENIISLTGLFTDVEQADATLSLAVTDVGNAALITSANVVGSDLVLTYGGIVGESTVTITATDNESASTPFTFTVIVSSSDTNLSVIKNAPANVLVGDQFIYTIDVTNNGVAIAQDVKITDILPGGVEFVSFNPSAPICAEVNGVVICNIAQIGAGLTETIEITVEAVSASQFYQLSATNSAPFTVPNLTLTHTIPDNLTFVNVVPSNQCSFNENTNTITCNFGSTAPGVTKFATVEVTSNEPSIITNMAIVSADNADTVASNQAITTVEASDVVLDASALVEITPGGGLGASTYGGSSIQITNNSAAGVNITSLSIDFSTGILPDMVFDPVGTGGDATASCFTANVGGAAVGVVAPADPCVDPYTVPRNGGFDVMTLAFTDFGAGEYFAFTTDVDPNSIQGVPGAGNAGAVSGYELTGSTVTVTFSDGTTEQILVSNIYEDGSLGGGQAVVANDALDAPTIALLGYPTTPVTVNDTAQTVQVTGTPGANVSLLLMDTRLYIATGAPPFGVTDTTYYANEAMSGKTLYTGVIPAGGTLNVPVTLLQTLSGDATPDGGLNRLVAVLSDAPYAVDTQVSQTSNVLVVKYDPDFVSPGIVFDPATITVNVVAGESTTINVIADSSDASTLPTSVAILDFDDATNLDAAWLSTVTTMDQGASYALTIDATSLTAGTTLTGRLEGTVAGYEIGILPITLNVVETAGAGVATVSITPGGGLGASTYSSSSFQISNNSLDDVSITGVSIDFSTAILPDMVFDPVGAGGDATASCFTPNSGAAAVGVIAPADPCVDPFSVPRNGGFDVMTVNFNDFGAGETFAFTTDVDPNSIQGVPGAGNAGAVSGYELIGSTVTVSFSDGSVVATSLFEDGSLGGSIAVAAANAPATPGIAVQGVSPTPAIVNTLNQTVIVTGTPGADVSLLQMDARLFIASGDPAFNVSDPTFYANEAMSGKSVYTGTIGLDGTLAIPVTLLQTAGATGTPDGGLNHFIAVVESGIGEQTSQTSNVVILKYDPNYTGPALVITPQTLDFVVQADIITGDSFVVSTSDSSVVTGVTLTAEDATLNAPAWLTIPATTDTGVSQNLTVDTTGLSDGLYTATVTASAAGYLPVNMQVSVTVGTVSSQAICINAGGPAYTTVADSFFPAGVEFLADDVNVSPWFDSGSKSTFTNDSIVLTNSDNKPLFSTERSATANLVPFNFALDVNPGQYLVQMYFADIYFGATGGGGRDANDGQRVFDLTVEPGTANEVLLLDDYDLNADVGPETVVLHQGIFTVSDSQLNINFTPSVDQAKISALCVTPVTGGGNIAPTINPIADATVSEGDIFATTISAFDSEIVSLSATVEDALAAPVSATITDNGNNTISISIPTLAGDAGDIYTVTVTADDGVNPVATETFLVYVIPVSENNPSVEILITDGVTDNIQSWNDVSTYGGDSFTIENTGDVNITSVAFNVSTTYMPDIVFDPVAHGGDTVAKCFDANTGAAAVGLVTADGACGVPPFGLPNLDQQAGDTDPDAGYFGLTLTFNNFNPNETFGFSVDMDPSSIKGDTTQGGSGGISGMELIGSTVTVTFEDGTIITAPVWLDGVQSNAGGRVIIGQFAPVAPSISMVGLTTPTTTNVLSQMVQVLGTPNAPFTLLQVDGRLHIDSGSANGDYPNGYDIDPYEANESIGKTVYSGTLNGSGVAMVPLNLMLTTQTYGGPNGGINHFIAVINGLNGQTSGTSNVLVVEYDPNFTGGDNTPPVVTNPGTQTSQSGVPITPLQIVATAPELDQTVAFSATNLPQGLSINPSTGVISGTPTCAVVGGAGPFQESQSGLFSVEVESVPPTDDWTIETAVNGASGDYYEWQNGSTFTGVFQPGQGVLSYPVQIETPGRYRFLWRTASPNSTEHNDTWVRVTGTGSDAVGVQGSDEIQIGNGQGWIKVYQNTSGNNWAWVANTVDDDAHQIYFDFATAGVYTVEFSARSTLHKLDRWVLYNSSYNQSQATNLNVPVSQRVQPGGNDNCTYDVEVTVIDNGTPIGVTITEFQWNVTTDVVVENVVPTADAGSYANPILDTDTLAGETVTLDGSGSSDTDGTINTYNWTVNGNPVNQNTATPTVNLNDGANTVSLIVIDDDGASSTASQIVINVAPYVPVGECGGLVVEAESGVLSGNFAIGNDASASGGQYVHAPDGTGSYYSPGSASYVTLCFTVTQAGTYQILGSVWSDEGGNDSFYATVNGTSYLWDILSNGTYAQDYVNNRNVADPVQIDLPVGEVEVIVSLREDGARLDTLELELISSTENIAPTANVGTYGTVADTDNVAGETVTLAGSGTDTDGTIATYNWTVNGTPVNQNTATPTVNLNDGANTVSLIVIDDDGASSTASQTTITVEAPDVIEPTCGPLTQQAENGALAGNFTTATSGSASGGQYILTPNGSGNSNGAPSATTTATYCFNVTETGTYQITGQVSGKSQGNTFWVQVSGSNYLWDIPTTADFVQDYVNNRGGADPVQLNLTAGQQLTVVVTVREDGAWLDTIGLELIGGVENVAPTADAGSYANPIAESDNAVGETVTLDGSGSSDTDGTIATYNWTVNGNPVNQNTATPTVNLNDGANSVSLIVIDDDGASSAPSQIVINVQAYIPTGNTCGGLVVEAESGELSGNFAIGNDASASGGQYVHSPDGTGSYYSPGSASYVTLCLTVPQAGTYQILGWVWSNDGSNDSFYATVNGTSYLWDILSNGTYAQDYVNGRNVADPVQVVLPAGEVEIIVGLREDGARLDKLQLELVGGATPNVAPTANVGTYGTVADTNGVAGETVTLAGSGTDTDGTIATYNWTVNGTPVNQNTATPTVNLNNGANSVSLIVIDDDGASSAPSTTTINVTAPVPQNQAPTANVGTYGTVADTNGVAGETVTLAGSGTDTDGTIATYNWTVNGTPVNQNTATPTVNLNNGANSVSLIVIDDDGASSAPSTTTINVTAPVQSGPGVSSFSLMDAITDTVISPLTNNAVLNINTLPAAINVRANTNPATVGSVVFSLTGTVTESRTENGAPYALFSDNAGNYFDWTPVAGSYTLTATSYSGSNGSGTAGASLTVNFTIQAGGGGGTPTGDLITNIQVANGKSYQHGTLATGTAIFIDRDYTFTNVPATLNGDEFIQTANDDKTVSNPNFLTFTLSANATVYVAWDSRYPAPSWLSSWTLTGLSLVGQDFNNTTLSRVVYSQNFPAGQVTLPASATSSSGISYTLIAEPQGVSALSVTIPDSGTREVPPIQSTTIPVAPVDNNGIIVIPSSNGVPQTDEQGIIVIPAPNGG